MIIPGDGEADLLEPSRYKVEFKNQGDGGSVGRAPLSNDPMKRGFKIRLCVKDRCHSLCGPMPRLPAIAVLSHRYRRSKVPCRNAFSLTRKVWDGVATALETGCKSGGQW